MDQPQVDPKGKGVGTTESNCLMNTDIKKLAWEASAARMGQDKNKNSACKFDRFFLFSANPSLMGSSLSSHPCLVLLQPRFARGLLIT
jgi:hypothetical protein